MQSSSEINTVSKRAARAAGYSWGIAEEVGKCISSIEMFGIRGVENLNNYFKTIKDTVFWGDNLQNLSDKLFKV